MPNQTEDGRMISYVFKSISWLLADGCPNGHQKDYNTGVISVFCCTTKMFIP